MKTIHIFKTGLLTSLMGLFFLNACEREIPFDEEVKEPKLVINALFSPDSVWQIHLSNSLSVIDNAEPSAVTNATVELRDAAGNLLETLSHDSLGFYSSPNNLQPQSGLLYTITASAPNYKTVTSSDIAPLPIQVTNVDTASTLYQGEEKFEVKITFQDPPGENNFYSISALYEDYYVYGTDTFFTSFPLYFQTSDPNVEVQFEDGYSQQMLFSDQLIQGQNYTLTAYMDRWFLQGNAGNARVTLQVTSCSEAFYLYQKSYSAYSNTAGNPFAQPVQVYSNVEEGFGIFAGGTTFEYLIAL